MKRNRGAGSCTLAQKLIERAVVPRLMELAPEAGMKWANGRELFERSPLAEWLRRDPSAAALWMTPGAGKNQPSPWLELRWTASPEELDAALRAVLGNSAISSLPDGNTLRMLAVTSPEKAKRLLSVIPAGDSRRGEFASAVASGLACADPAAAVAWLQSAGITEGFQNALFSTLEKSAFRQPEAVRTLLETSGLPPEQQSRVQLQVASGLSRDPAALRDYLKTLPDKGLKVQAYAIGTLPAVRMKMDDLYSLACELERTRPSFYGHTMFDWTGTDPANLLLEAAKLPDTDSRGVIVDSLSQALLLNGNGLTAAQAANLPESVRGQSLKYLAALEIAKDNRAGAMELIDLITPVNYEGKRMQWV